MKENNDEFDKLKVGNNIMVEVLGKRFDSGEDQISVIGLFKSMV